MAFGLPAFYVSQFALVGTLQSCREAVVYSLDVLGWKYQIINSNIFRVTRPMNGLSWGETIIISFENPAESFIRSECSFPLQLFDWGVNKRNVNEFFARFTIKAIQEARLESHEPSFFNDKGQSPVERVFSMTDDGEIPSKK